ncbi:response regulator [Geopsychrobacter electrodiphilus]|uniref:response regulator n=1 Tax=Geopsychrobacter electrodiphilus TaxID=225196 RepID=UPI0003685F72|nr:response regulator [Geopsychrobacter electrodiphilus]
MAKILLVDDVDLFLELERSYLEGLGYDLVTASSGEETLARIERVEPDILLLDFYMPGIDGDEVCATLRKNPRWQNLPIIMVTAAGKPEEVQRCLLSGCDDYITKPVNKQELREKVKRLLGLVHRRTVDRVPLELSVNLKGAGQEQQLKTRDVSHNGVYLKTETLLPENSMVELSIKLSDEKTLDLFGKVKRIEQDGEKGLGVYLVNPDAKDQKDIDNLIRQGMVNLRAGSGGDVNLHQRMLALERECARMRSEQEDNQRRIGELEEENLEFANQLVQVEDVNNNLTNLYIASSRLHSTLDRKETLEIIKEVVINFVGAEKFAVFIHDEAENTLSFETGEGFEDDQQIPEIKVGEGLLGGVAERCENYFGTDMAGQGSDDPLAPLVAIPLMIQGELLGLLAIYRLFIQKEELASIDYQLFSMLGDHAATALFSSTLYGRSERKRQTYQGFMDLLLK